MAVAVHHSSGIRGTCQDTFLMKQGCCHFEPSFIVFLISSNRLVLHLSFYFVRSRINTYLSGDKEFENLGMGADKMDKQAILSNFSNLSCLSS